MAQPVQSPIPISIFMEFVLFSANIQSSSAANPKGSEYSSVKLPPARTRFNPNNQTAVPIKAGASPNCFLRRINPKIDVINRDKNSVNQTPQRVPFPIAKANALIKKIPGGFVSHEVLYGRPPSDRELETSERLPPKGGRFKTSGGLNRRLKDYAPKGGGFYRLPPSAAKAVCDNRYVWIIIGLAGECMRACIHGFEYTWIEGI